MVKYLKKIIFLFSNLRNPSLFVYLLHHYLQRNVPKRLANFISQYNRSKIDLESYDGSNQHVHPDMVLWKSKYWVVTTPYPFGMEEYENPSIYVTEDLLEYKSIVNNPIDKPSIQRIGFHMSDPCLFVLDQKLMCAYRITERKANNEIKNQIALKGSTDGFSWSNMIVLLESYQNELISPAFLTTTSGKVCAFYIEPREKNIIKYVEFSESWGVEIEKSFTCKNIPDNYYVWHIGISHIDGSKMLQDGFTKGIFLLKSSSSSGDFKLFIATLTNGNWVLNREIHKKDISNDVKFIYKSCFIPDSDEIMVSYRNNHDVYKLAIVKL